MATFFKFKTMKRSEILANFELPLMTLLARAHKIHAENFDENTVQCSSLVSVKTGGCSEDCKYCAQSARYQKSVGLTREKTMPLAEVLEKARAAKANGASRFCMGWAFKAPKASDMAEILPMIKAVKALGLQTCVTLGMVSSDDAKALKEAGLDYYNHNLDTSPEFYANIVSTHSFDERLKTLENLRQAKIKLCAGGIIGMGESRDARAGLLEALSELEPPPESVPINQLVAISGTPLDCAPPLDSFEFVRTIACARLAMPKSFVRIAAGRAAMSDELQALCFFAGANSIFQSEKLLTTSNAAANSTHTAELFKRLQLKAV